MKKFTRSDFSENTKKSIIGDIIARFKLDEPKAKLLCKQVTDCQVWVNDIYQVNLQNGIQAKHYIHLKENQIEDFLYLSIKRKDKEAIFDIEHLQQIKDELAGENRIAIELYPSQARVLDCANQYHLFVFPEKTFPFEFNPNEFKKTSEFYSDHEKQVFVYRQPSGGVCIKIKRHDNKKIRDWRDIQSLKNEITNENREAIMIYPHKKFELEGNYQYLFVIPEKTWVPFGSLNGAVDYNTERSDNSKQRACNS